MEKLVSDPFIKMRTKYISGKRVRTVINFVFIVCPSQGINFIKTKVLATCFYCKVLCYLQFLKDIKYVRI